ncbi:MAG TPA: GntR family transcriptional regulator [bacterium]|nr:GntR family transcriptional regulator [bacterium]
MLIVVDPHSGVPVYRQLMDQVKFHIASGVLVPGDELPSTRALSAELGVNPMTISKAYSFLEREDVVERRPGRPLVVKAAGKADLEDRRIEQVRQSLSGPVTVVRQLGVSAEDAVRLFQELLADAGDAGQEDEDA